MPTQRTKRTDKGGDETHPSRQNQGPSNALSAPTSNNHPLVDDSPTTSGPNQCPTAVTDTTQDSPETNEVLESVPESPDGGIMVSESSAADSDEWENIEMGSREVLVTSEDDEELEVDSDPIEDEDDSEINEEDIVMLGLLREAEEYVWNDSSSDSLFYDQSGDASMFSNEAEEETSDEDSDLPDDPYEREILGSMAEPETSLHTTVVRGEEKSMKRWRAWSSCIWAQKVKGDTDLHFAARSGDVATVEQLLQDGALLNIKNKKRHTALEVASLCGHAGVVKVFLKYGAAADSEEMEHALLAAKSTTVIRVLVEGEPDAVKGITGAEILSRAARDGRVAMVKELLKAGADPNWPCSFNRSALHTAASRGHVKCVAALLKSGADVTCLDDQRWTPLHYAAFHSHGEVVQQLVKAGSDLNAKSGFGQTPFDVAFDELIRSVLKEPSQC